MKLECPTFLKSKGKTMTVTLSDDDVSDHKSGNDDDGSFIAFTATVVVDENVVAKDAMNVDLGLQKIASLELDKKICS